MTDIKKILIIIKPIIIAIKLSSSNCQLDPVSIQSPITKDGKMRFWKTAKMPTTSAHALAKYSANGPSHLDSSEKEMQKLVHHHHPYEKSFPGHDEAIRADLHSALMQFPYKFICELNLSRECQLCHIVKWICHVDLSILCPLSHPWEWALVRTLW